MSYIPPSYLVNNNWRVRSNSQNVWTRAIRRRPWIAYRYVWEHHKEVRIPFFPLSAQTSCSVGVVENTNLQNQRRWFVVSLDSAKS
jgi:hypothetical protein